MLLWHIPSANANRRDNNDVYTIRVISSERRKVTKEVFLYPIVDSSIRIDLDKSINQPGSFPLGVSCDITFQELSSFIG